MNNRSKQIRVLIAIIIPLLVAVFVANYSYNWDVYQSEYKEIYLSKGETSRENIDAFINLENYMYQKDPFYYYEHIQEVDGEEKSLFKLLIVGQIILSNTDEPYMINYRIFLYDVDYESLIHLTKEDVIVDTKRHVDFKLSFIFEDEKPITKSFGAIEVLDDKGALPEYHKDLKTNYKVLSVIHGGEKTLNNFKIRLYEGDLVYDELTHDVEPKNYDEYTQFFEVSFDELNMDLDKVDYDEYVSGLQGQITRTDYSSYIWKRKLWWQVIIAFVAVGLITSSFFIVWNYEQQQDQDKKNK